ncbi:MAG: outer membrane protein transport protein [Draconibacterium sp.]|nr:outer membrane protein transport protein [Draconibacterium sp.]
MKRYFVLFALILSVPFFIQAQDFVDALRYSQIQTQGTARSGGMGNAFGALGGDFTSVSINPAGIGLYRSGEFAVTPNMNYTKVNSTYYRTDSEDTNYKLSLNNISYVSAIPTKATSEAGIISVNIGLGYNRIKDFNSNAIMTGNNVKGSYLDYFADNANAAPQIWNDYYEELAWKTDLLLHDDNNDEYWHDIQGRDIQHAGYGQNQRKTKSQSGSIDEYSFAIGVNFNHKLYLGTSVGITSIYYKESTQIFEEDAQNNIPYFNDMSFNSDLNTTGNGYNFKFGAIYKPINEIRLGVSIHTPTFYKLHDSFETSMHSSITYDDGTTNYDEYSPYSNYNYRLETPLRATFSGAVIIAKKGLISMDYELVNYGNAKFRNDGNGNDFVVKNQDIADVYKSAGNIRIGGEYNVAKGISLRAGYELQQSAFNTNAFGALQANSDANLKVYSAGLGYRSGLFFADVAYRYSVLDNFELPYPTPISNSYPAPQMAAINTVKNNVLFTIGYKF